jgi:hypothetical protein
MSLPNVSPSDLEAFWMSGTAQEPALELDADGRIKPIQPQVSAPPAPRGTRPRAPQLRLPEFRWD